jgi:ATP-dependent Lon protease
MTGEITLKGKVLPVGGIKGKLLAAHREGIKEAILPIDNKPDLRDLPKNIKDDMNIHFVEHMDDVLKIALTKDISEVLKKEKELLSEEEPQKPPVTH